MVTRLETLEALPAQARKTAPANLAMIDVSRIEDARDAWAELSALAPISPYQSYLFLSVWFDTIGREEGLEPFVISARDAAGRPRTIVPLAIETRAGLRIAAFVGGRESNFNLALLLPNSGFTESNLRTLFVEAAKKTPNPPDLIYLRNQPKRFEGVDNPLAFADSRPSASFAYGATLPRKAEELSARLSKDARKKLRKKEARLAEMGELVYEHRATGARAEAILAALIEQKSARFSEMGLGGLFDSAAFVEMLRRLSKEAGEGALELHGLSIDGRVVATYAGLARGGRFSAFLNSFEMDEDIARCSPGDLLLHALMRDLVGRGMTHFDLGAGEARYKNSVCDETIELCDVIVPVTWRGVAAAPLFSAFLRLKRRIKQTPALARAYVSARRLLRGAR